jgi:hypothetical protein
MSCSSWRKPLSAEAHFYCSFTEQIHCLFYLSPARSFQPLLKWAFCNPMTFSLRVSAFHPYQNTVHDRDVDPCRTDCQRTSMARGSFGVLTLTTGTANKWNKRKLTFWVLHSRFFGVYVENIFVISTNGAKKRTSQKIEWQLMPTRKRF